MNNKICLVINIYRLYDHEQIHDLIKRNIYDQFYHILTIIVHEEFFKFIINI